MKKISLFSVVILALITFTACSGDDDGGPTGPTISNQIFATWNMVFFIENGVLNSDVECDSDIEYKFNSNKTYSKTLFSEPSNGGNTCDISLVINGSWEIVSDDVLKLTPSSSTFSTETLTLKLFPNNQQLEIKRSLSLTEVYDRL